MIATAPGKLMLTGEYAVLDGAPALLVAVDRRAVARRAPTPPGSSPFLLAVADEIAARRGGDAAAAREALQISVDSTAFYDRGSTVTKLGLGSSAAVTVAATALALGTAAPDEVLEVALAAHARAQGPRGSRGSGADIAASVYGGTIAFTREGDHGCKVVRQRWPSSVTLLPFFTGAAADTAQLVARMNAARAASPRQVDAALAAIADASRAAITALSVPPELAQVALIGAIALAAAATDRLAGTTGIDLVPECVTAARAQLARLGGTAKTTGAGGGDAAIAVIPATADATAATRMLIEAGCQPLRIARDETGVDLRTATS